MQDARALERVGLRADEATIRSGELWRRDCLALPVNGHNGRGGAVRSEGERGVLAAALRHAGAAHPGRRIGFVRIRSDGALPRSWRPPRARTRSARTRTCASPRRTTCAV